MPSAPPDAAVAPVVITLLGPFGLRVAGAAEAPALERKTRAILAYLAATGRPHPREALWTLFCQTAADPPAGLRWHLSRIRRLTHPDLVQTTGPTVALYPAVAWVDCRAFEERLGRDPTARDAAALAAAVDLYRGELLAGLQIAGAPEFELWLLGERARYRRLYTRGLTALVDRLIADGQYEPAIARARQLLQHEPLLEEAHLRLIWLYAQTDRRAAALQQFAQCRDLLQRELAVAPMPALIRLHDQILRRQGVAGRAPWEPAAARTPQAAQAAATPFVGRRLSWRRCRTPGKRRPRGAARSR